MTPVSQLPGPKAPPQVLELERQLLGAVLHLGVPASSFEAMGLAQEDFTLELHAKAWGACRRQAEAGVSYSHETVSAAGLRRGALTLEESRALASLAEANALTPERLRVVAHEFRRLRSGLRTAAALEAEVQRIRRGDFDEAATAGRLSAIERELHRQSARIEDLTGDQARMLERWDTNQREGRSDILATGIKVLDAEVGGLPQRLCLFAADAGVGKTALIDSMQHAMLTVHPALRIGLISPEDGVEHVPKRWMARETGWLLREIGNRPRTADEEFRVQEIAARHLELLKRILGYRERSISADQLIALCWSMVERGAGCVFIDNFNKITLAGGANDYHERVQRFSDRLSEFAEKAKVPAVLVVHTTGEEQTGKRGVSGSAGVQGGRSLGRDARFRLDLFRKDGQLRGLIAKANELGEQGTVIQFSRQATAGLIDPDTGEKIDVNAEAAVERRERAARHDAEREEVRLKRKALRDAEKAKTAEAKEKLDEEKRQLELTNQARVEKPSGWSMRWTAETKEDSDADE